MMRREHPRANGEIILGNLRIDENAGDGMLCDFTQINIGARSGGDEKGARKEEDGSVAQRIEDRSSVGASEPVCQYGRGHV